MISCRVATQQSGHVMFWPTGHFRYARHTPETTKLYQLVACNWPEFKAMLSEQGKQLPGYVTREFDDYLKCGRLEHGFLRVRCETCHHEKLVAFSCKRHGFCPSCGAEQISKNSLPREIISPPSLNTRSYPARAIFLQASGLSR